MKDVMARTTQSPAHAPAVSGPLSLENFLPFQLSVASNLVSEIVATTYGALFNLKIPEWRVIAVVAERDGLNQQEIGQITRMDKVTVSRTVAALTTRGLLVRSAHRRDGRSHILALSAAGRTLYAAVAPKALDLEQRIFSAFDQAELDALVATLGKLRAIALKLQADLQG